MSAIPSKDSDVARFSALALKKATILSSARNNKSITRMAKESIIQYPLLMSSGVDNESAPQIAKSIERQMGAFLITYLSINNVINLSKYTGVGDYIKKFNNSSSIPKNLNELNTNITNINNFMSSAKESFIDIKAEDEFVLEALDIVAKGCERLSYLSEKSAAELWATVEDQVNASSLNDLYKPFNGTIAALESALIVMESTKSDALYSKIDKFNPETSDNSKYSPSRELKSKAVLINKTTIAPKSINIGGDKNLYALEPTMIEANFLITDASGQKVLQNAVLGVKSMVRTVPMDVMIANIVQGLSSKNPMFAFIKWTTGELGLVKDLLLGISSAKADATLSKGASKVFANLRSMQRKQKMGYVSGADIPLTTTLIITDYEVESIKSATNIDLRDEANALDFMYKHFLLGFGIFGTEEKTLSIIFDGDEYFADVSIKALVKGNSKDTSIENIKEISKLMGRF